MRKPSTFPIFLTILIIFTIFSQLQAAPLPSTGTVDVYFSPQRSATNAVVTELNNAMAEILVQAYSFTSAPIAKALVDAKKRGFHIEVVLDKSQKSEKYSSADFVAHAGIPVFINSKHAIAHNKIMIIDGKTLIPGSFNFTKSAEESNSENLLIM
jgi:phosphatidylserine/phosphatidylglycerophosphate/cardiolipin synthase-like enzyme